MHTVDIPFPSELIAKIVRCVEDAVGDDIRADIRQHDLQTRNSIPSRIWDLLNTNIIKTLDTEDCTIAKAHRGPWEMLIVFERSTQRILTFMREKRFTELRNRQHKRVHMHYIDMLAKQFNEDLLSDQQQLSFIPHTFSDEDRLAELVQTMLHDLEGDAEVVRHHVLVLFETVGYQLTHIRAVRSPRLWILPRTASRTGPGILRQTKALWSKRLPTPTPLATSRIVASALLQRLWRGKNLGPSKKSWKSPQKRELITPEFRADTTSTLMVVP